MKKLASVVAVVALALTGCGGSLCDDIFDLDKDFYDKTKACPMFNDDGAAYTEPTQADKDRCEQSFKSCTDADQDKIRDFNKCISDLDDCTAATEEAFSNKFTGCAFSHLANVSEACLAITTEESVRAALSINYSR